MRMNWTLEMVKMAEAANEVSVVRDIEAGYKESYRSMYEFLTPAEKAAFDKN